MIMMMMMLMVTASTFFSESGSLCGMSHTSTPPRCLTRGHQRARGAEVAGEKDDDDGDDDNDDDDYTVDLFVVEGVTLCALPVATSGPVGPR
jgi:hypothetical protein